MNNDLVLRNVAAGDLPVFFRHLQDAKAVRMAAFISREPSDRQAFDAHWKKILADKTIIIKTIVVNGEIAGYVLSYIAEKNPEVSYWIGREHWGKGIATAALKSFLEQVNTSRPMYARAAKDNAGSLRVLEKCGFKVINESMGYANARGKETAELLLVLEL